MGQSIDKTKPTRTYETIVPNPVQATVKYDITPPRFSVTNIEEIQQGIEHFNEHGYAVFSNVLSADEVNKSVDLFWKYLESLPKPYHIRRDLPETWDEPWPGSFEIGLLNTLGIGQSEFMWHIRGNPNVKKVFSHIWNSNELCVSFDGAGCFRNWHINPEWKTRGGWYHCDQNPSSKPDRCSIQGLVAVTDSDETTGGLVIVPHSHKHFLDLLSPSKSRNYWGNYLRIPDIHPLLQQLPPRLIKCKAGDLVVWDSRCIHCNTPALVDDNGANQAALKRIVAYICMSPLSLFAPDADLFQNLEEFRKLREEYVRNGTTCTHWPLELIIASENTIKQNEKLKLNTFQQSLIIGTDVEYEKDATEIEF
ncbi:unnamed protein product [Adineta ricciae]|uniref:Phytanoyl-CoA dioxygenase n=1 Tax=Adineta ricciae TaxID=249248 RepID=A0A814ST78_ADIRI|nr:unnamed protein product [Adineta ricciae]CAF1230253.1 unnamed protein product [Adineta ricciae]